jgi:hypothetical protein
MWKKEKERAELMVKKKEAIAKHNAVLKAEKEAEIRFVCVYVCMHACMYACFHVHIFILKNKFARGCVCISWLRSGMFVYMYACMLCECICCTHMCVFCVYTCIQERVCVSSVHTCTPVFLCVCKHACFYVHYTHTFVCVYACMRFQRCLHA